MNAARHTTDPWAIVALRWTARILSVASIGLLGAFVFGPRERAMPTPNEWLVLAFFPFGVVLGMVVGWWRELLGGIITLVGLVGLYAWMIARDGRPPSGPYFVLFALPGLLFLACGLLTRRAHPAAREG